MRVTRMMTVGLILSMGGLFAQESGDIPFTQADANGKLQKKSLPDDASAFRLSLGLGGAALLDVGTGAGTVAAGDDARLSNNIRTNVATQTILTGGHTVLTIGQIAGGRSRLSLNAGSTAGRMATGMSIMDTSAFNNGAMIADYGTSSILVMGAEDMWGDFLYPLDELVFAASDPWPTRTFATREWSNESSQTFTGRKQATGQPGQNGVSGTVANSDLATVGWAQDKFIADDKANQFITGPRVILTLQASDGYNNIQLDTGDSTSSRSPVLYLNDDNPPFTYLSLQPDRFNIYYDGAMGSITLRFPFDEIPWESETTQFFATRNWVNKQTPKTRAATATFDLIAGDSQASDRRGVIHFTASGNVSIGAFANGEANRMYTVLNVSAHNVTIENTANIQVRGGNDLVLSPGDGCTIYCRSATTFSVW